MSLEVVATGAARLGRTGVKLHKAVKFRATDDGKITEWVRIQCTCGCNSKHLVRFFENATPNCGG